MCASCSFRLRSVSASLLAACSSTDSSKAPRCDRRCSSSAGRERCGVSLNGMYSLVGLETRTSPALGGIVDVM